MRGLSRDDEVVAFVAGRTGVVTPDALGATRVAVLGATPREVVLALGLTVAARELDGATRVAEEGAGRTVVARELVGDAGRAVLAPAGLGDGFAVDPRGLVDALRGGAGAGRAVVVRVLLDGAGRAVVVRVLLDGAGRAVVVRVLLDGAGREVVVRVLLEGAGRTVVVRVLLDGAGRAVVVRLLELGLALELRLLEDRELLRLLDEREEEVLRDDDRLEEARLEEDRRVGPSDACSPSPDHLDSSAGTASDDAGAASAVDGRPSTSHITIDPIRVIRLPHESNWVDVRVSESFE